MQRRFKVVLTWDKEDKVYVASKKKRERNTGAILQRAIKCVL